MSEEIERIINECSCVDTFDYIITPQQRDTMLLAEYIKELQQENQKLKKVLDEIRELSDKYEIGRYDYKIPVFEIKMILDKLKKTNY